MWMRSRGRRGSERSGGLSHRGGEGLEGVLFLARDRNRVLEPLFELRAEKGMRALIDCYF